ncbi:lipopolysaccharide export system ATP-binding protein LptB [Spirochaetota bacterium]|nr:lipopolysaccharide export system ATP-binding protein LptB [Spirochaetota bacterium]
MFSIDIENIYKKYKDHHVIEDVSFNIKQGEIVGLLGPNGAGKTTSFYITVGLIAPTSGSVILNKNFDIVKMPMHKRAQLGIGYLPQEASIFRKLTVKDNIIAILETRKLTPNAAKEACQRLLERFKITHVQNQYGYTLSGGERRRTEIARALAADPKILLLDEPFAGVDPIAIADIQSIILEIQKLNIGILITDHNVRETLKIVSRAYIMARGKILIEGTAQQLIKSREAKKIYLGEDFKL